MSKSIPLNYSGKNWEIYTNEYGMIGELKPHGLEYGDSLQRDGFFDEANYFLGNPPDQYFLALKTHRRKAGVFVRDIAHSGGPHDDPRITSRDQLRSNVRALGYRAKQGHAIAKKYLKELLWAQIKRGIIFYPNTRDLDPVKRNIRRFPDVANPEHIGEWIRSIWSFGPYVYLLYPFLFLADIWSIFATITKIVFKNNMHPDFADDDHRIGTLLQQNEIAPTGLGVINKWIYTRFRKIWVGWYVNQPTHLRPQVPYIPAQYALDRKYTGLNAPPFNEKWRPIIATKF